MRVGQMAAASGGMADPEPIVLGRYRLLCPLGAGGFGTVWLARDEHLAREVAVKILPLERVVGGRFEREARAAARLSHPAIVTLFEAAADDRGAYLVSEVVRGTTLDRAMGDGRLSDRSVLAIAVALCEALAHAHAHGVVHRDVKPSNVLIPDHAGPSGPPAKLTDFGVARVVGGDALTHTGELVGTWQYMAPEQAMGRAAGEESDLYALALVVYEALTGVNPVWVACGGARPRRVAPHLPPLRRQRRELPRELGQAIDHALRPRAAERGSLVELSIALRATADRVSDVPGVVAPPRLRLRRRAGEPTGLDTPEPPDTVDDPQGRPADDASTEIDGGRSTRRWWSRPGSGGRTGRGDPERQGDGTDEEAMAATWLPADGSPRGAERTWTQRAMDGWPRLAEPAPTDLDEVSPHPDAPASPRRLTGVPSRLAASALTGALTAWVGSALLTSSPLAPATLALVATLAVAVAPRAGWLLAGLGLSVLLGVEHRAGMACLLLAGVLPVIVVLPRRGPAWPLALGAVALGVAGLAPAWPALAARSPSVWRRAVLAAVGWWWLCLAAPLSAHALLIHAPALARAAWLDSPSATVHHILSPLLEGPALAGAVVWALSAAALPVLRRGLSGPADLAAVLVWSALVPAATMLALELTGAAHLAPPAVAWLGGAALGAATLVHWPRRVVAARVATWRDVRSMS